MLMFNVDIAFNQESQRYYVVRSDIAGLNASAKTVEELSDVIKGVAPDLIQANHMSLFTRMRSYARGLVNPSSKGHGLNVRLSHHIGLA